MRYAAWGNSGSSALRTGGRREVFDAARRAGRRGVTVHDEDGGVFTPDGTSTTCPDCHRDSGQHVPGPPHCRREVFPD